MTEKKNTEPTPISDETTPLGNMIKSARISAGLGLRETAKQLMISPTYLSRLENGWETRPSDEIIHKMVELLGLESHHLFVLAKRIPKTVLVAIAGDSDLLLKVLKVIEDHEVQP